MKLKFIMTLMLIFAGTNSYAIQLGKEGGGGSSLPSEGRADRYKIMEMARTELVLLFHRQSLNPSSPEIAKVLSGPQTIIDVILNTPIHESFIKCKDINNNDVDGSIYAPTPGAICIYSSLVDKFLPEEGRKQLLALAAHEYSHLVGLNEAEAERLQKKVYLLLNNSVMAHNYEALDRANVSFASARGAIIIFKNILPSGNIQWRHRCEVAEQLQKYFGQIWGNNISNQTEFSIFNKASSKLFVSYVLKIRALNVGACRLDDGNLDQALYTDVYNAWFGKKTMIDSKYLAGLLTDQDTAENIFIQKIQTEKIFDAELFEITNYVEDMFNYSFELKHLKDKEKWPLR